MDLLSGVRSDRHGQHKTEKRPGLWRESDPQATPAELAAEPVKFEISKTQRNWGPPAHDLTAFSVAFVLDVEQTLP